ncbi:MAG: aminoglycoside 3'-phosphotransferase [Candidatus Cloacimonetes bacterium]|nr:aminoglycoside 3'-phosphotransferase [Candidatus Cloacimonadota bacterium]
MTLKPLTIDLLLYPAELHSFILGAKIYDSSCSPHAKVIYIDKDDGYFLKSSQVGSKKLQDEVELTQYFHKKGLAPEALAYITNECDHDWLLTTKIQGDDCTTSKYLDHPERLCDTIAEQLVLLHNMDFSDCPVQNHTDRYLKTAEYNKQTDNFDKSYFPDSFGYESPEEAWVVIQKYKNLLKTEILLHGDYCLPNIILKDWKFSGFVDLDSGGVGDRHVDVFWGIWTLWYNLRTDKFRQRFIDVYGRDIINEDLLRLVAAIEVFTWC